MPVFGKETEGGQETDMRVEQAEKAMQSFLDRFYVVDEDNDRGEIVGEFFWTRAEMFEVVVDAYEKTGEEKYKDLMAQMYRGFVKSYGEEWSDNDFNDDIMWMTIGCARAYELTGETFYKEQAEHHFKLVFDLQKRLHQRSGSDRRLPSVSDNEGRGLSGKGEADLSVAVRYALPGEWSSF